jgi:hypothetical protein
MLAFCNPAPAAQFKADMVMGQSGATKTGKFYVKGSKYRMDQRDDGRQIVVLVDQDAGMTRVLVPARKIYMEMKSDEPRSQMNDPFQGAKHLATLTEVQKLGSEKVSGYVCDKYLFKDKGKDLMSKWVSTSLHFPIKIVNHVSHGMFMELKNIQETNLDDSLFQLPPGYTKMGGPGPVPPAQEQTLAKKEAQAGSKSPRRKLSKKIEFAFSGEGRDTDMTSMEKAVNPHKDLLITITGNSQFRLESKGKFSLYKGTKLEKVKEITFLLKAGESKSWDFSADKQIKSIGLAVYGKGEIKVSIEQGSGSPGGPMKAQVSASTENASPQPTRDVRPAPAQAGSFSALADEAKKSYSEGDKIAALMKLKSAVQSIWDEIPLTVINVRLVKDTHSYAIRHNNSYNSGQTIHITSQLLGYKLKKVGETYTINITVDFYVLDKKGKKLGGKENFAELKRQKAIPITDFDMDFRYTISYPKGMYDIQTIIHDQNSGKTATFIVPIEIR